VSGKMFYLLLHSIALKTLLLSYFKMVLITGWGEWVSLKGSVQLGIIHD